MGKGSGGEDDSSASSTLRYAALTKMAASLGHTAKLNATPIIVQSLRLFDFGADLDTASDAVQQLLPAQRSAARQRCAASSLVVAQQCGGSDAFSGTAANPLLADASKLLIEAGGSALLAETDELIGAEQYVLQSVSDYATASSQRCARTS